MKIHSSNLRHEFAANPTRFLPAAIPQLAALPSAAQARAARPLRLVPSALDERSGHLSDQLRRLGLRGMARALVRLEAKPAEIAASHTRWLSLLVDGEVGDRREKRIAARLRAANLRYRASMADLDYNAPRGFDDALFHWLAIGDWLADKENLIIDGPAGIGKTWLACALGERACRDDRSVVYERVPQLLADLDAARGSARYARRMRALRKAELLILDDWGIERFAANGRHDMLEIIEARSGCASTLFASPVAVEHWPLAIGDPAIASMILDRIVPSAHRLTLRGNSLRRRQVIGRSRA